MKTLIILFLLAVIVGLAFITRPSERSFQAILSQQLQEATPAASSIPPVHNVDDLMKDITYKDRYLWADVQKDGKTVYTGAFGHWFEWGKIVEAPAERTTIKLPV